MKLKNIRQLTTGGYFCPVPSFIDTMDSLCRFLGDGATVNAEINGVPSLFSVWSPSASLRKWGQENAEWLEYCASCEWSAFFNR